jgi:hypothetical protein
MVTPSNEARARAEATFKKEERVKEGAEAMMEYQASSRMIREKTERLRALRLANEAANRAADAAISRRQPMDRPERTRVRTGHVKGT